MRMINRGALAAVMADGSRPLTYGELEDASLRLAQLFRDRGLVPGDRVAIMLENCPEWFICAWGARRAGLFFVPVNWHLTSSEAGYVIGNSDARALITSHGLAARASEAASEAPAVEIRLAVGGGERFDDLHDALASYPAVALDIEIDGGSMVYSSGTTGRPKGVLRELGDEIFGKPNGLEAMLRDNYGIDEHCIYLSTAPLYHAAPVGWTGTVLVLGGTVVIMSAFDPESALAAIDRFRVTHAQFVPTHFVRLLRLPEQARSRHDLSSLHLVVHGAAPCSPQVKRAMIQWFGPIIHEYYSGSERCGFTKIDSAAWLARPGSVGRSIGGAIHILDIESGEEMANGEIGAVYFDQPVPFVYHKDNAKTSASFQADGWATFGDVGHVDADGYLYLADRRTDLILSGGVNIYPQEIENILIGHAAVADVGVVGIPNEEFGQEVKAVVQLIPGACADAAELIAFCREQLAGFKAPRTIDFTETLPRHPSGKLLRREILDRYRNVPIKEEIE